MSSKLKNLSYGMLLGQFFLTPKTLTAVKDSHEPSFLRKLREENVGLAPDRQERPVARPKRSKDAADDDSPTYVIEESNDTLSKAEYEALVKEEARASEEKVADSATAAVGDGAGAGDEQNKANRKDGQTSKQQTTNIGKAQQKRKLGKVVGADDAQTANGEKRLDKKPKKKVKGVKLSFGDDEVG